jgi:hypothetical protein
MKSTSKLNFNDYESTSFTPSLASVSSGSMKYILGSRDFTGRNRSGP